MMDFTDIVARSDAMRDLLPCPRCASKQVQFIGDPYNGDNDICRCRECKCSALRTFWQKAPRAHTV
jgi:hypothetical protein